MASLLIRSVAVVTLDPNGSVLPQADIAVADGRIVAVGQVPPNFVPGETLDGCDHVAMPGFFNTHTHTPMTYMRGWGDDLPFDRWLNERVWNSEAVLTADDVKWGAYLAVCEMIRSGTVGYADHYFYMDAVAQAAADAGLRATLTWCIFGGKGDVGADLAGSEAFIRRWHDAAAGRIRAVLGPHSPYICEPDFLRTVAERAQALGTGVHLHVAETWDQVEASRAHYGKTPVEHLADLGIFDVPTIAAHCIALTPDDMDILASKHVNPVQCPQCHMKFGMGRTPVPELLARGVNVCLGTDGPGSNDNLDMLEEVRTAHLMQKQHLADPTALPGDLSLRLATQNGARALGFPNSGVIAPGYDADLILFDFHKPHLRPRHNLVNNIVHSANSADIDTVIVAGRILMKNRKLVTLDEEHILFEAERSAFRMIAESDKMRLLRQYTDP
jgi:5-methylthioadenosine/S-adenosylhomocysteine deaminase